MIIDPNWRLSDADYAAEYMPMFTAFKVTATTAQGHLPTLDAMIDAITGSREGHWQDALESALKERNAYARFAGVAERSVDPSWLPPTARSGPFSLIRQAVELVPLMTVPSRPLKIAVADDQKIVLIMMGKLLDIWPSTTIQWIHQQAGSAVMLDVDVDIALLDEHMDGRSGSAVYAFYQSQGHQAVFASISTTGNKPKWAVRQYDQKTTISGNRTSAEDFVRFMNALIAEALAKKP